MIKKTENEIMKNWKAGQKPLVSICSFTYNHEKFIAQALDSMLMQKTDFPFEIIIRDDCSTDQTEAIIQEYVEEFPNIIRPIFETENQYSKGFSPFPPVYEKARGKYVAMLEGDDYWRDEYKLQKQADFLEKHDEYVLSYHNSIVVNEDGELISEAKIRATVDYTSDQMLCAEVFILFNSVMFRKVINLSQGQMDNVLSGDSFLWHLLGYHGKSKYQEGIIYAAYRIHSGGIWSSLEKIEKFENNIKFKQALKNMLTDSDNRLKKRIVKSANRSAAMMLIKSLKVLDFKVFGGIVRVIVKSDDLSIFKVLLFMPSLFVQVIKHKYLKLSTKKK